MLEMRRFIFHGIILTYYLNYFYQASYITYIAMYDIFLNKLTTEYNT